MVFDLMLKLYFNVLLNKNELNMCMNLFFFPLLGPRKWDHPVLDLTTVISGLPLLKIHCNNKLLMPTTEKDRTSDSIEALGSGQLNQFRTWDLYFPSVCCISLSDTEKFSMGAFMGKMQNKLLPYSSHGCTVDSFLIILIFKMSKGEESLTIMF